MNIIYDVRPKILRPIPWGWENDDSGSWVKRPRGEIVMPALTDYFSWYGEWEARPVVEITHDEGRGILGSTSMKSVFTTATRFLGAEEALVRLAEGRLDLYAIAREMLAWNLMLISTWPFAHPLRLMVQGDEIASSRGLLMSPALYREHILPLHASFVRLAQVHGVPIWYHADGDISEVLDDIRGAGYQGVYYQDIGRMREALDLRPDLGAVEMRREESQWSGTT
jgi:hypothetical protein